MKESHRPADGSFLLRRSLRHARATVVQEEFDRIYRSYFTNTEALLARTRMQAGRTPMDCGLEVEAIGYVP